jgi:hypothetical protein
VILVLVEVEAEGVGEKDLQGEKERIAWERETEKRP